MILIGKKLELDPSLIGQKFKKLTIIGFTTVERNRRKCICKCDCGNETLATLRELEKGHKKSCGCLRVSQIDKYTYLIGQKINKWTILSLRSEGKKCFATCMCECGTVKEVNIQNIISDRSKDCGCGRKKMLSETRSKNLIGQRFGKLVVIEKLPDTNKFNKVLYKCKCSCGNETIVDSNSLVSGHTKSCGCLNSYYNMYIDILLDKMQIEHTSEYSVVIDGKRFRFDFYLPEYNLMIEYDGEQHYMPVSFGEKDLNKVNNKFELIQEYDQLKNNYCEQNNINLLRIPYWEKQNIENIIYNYLQRLSGRGFAA